MYLIKRSCLIVLLALVVRINAKDEGAGIIETNTLSTATPTSTSTLTDKPNITSIAAPSSTTGTDPASTTPAGNPDPPITTSSTTVSPQPTTQSTAPTTAKSTTLSSTTASTTVSTTPIPIPPTTTTDPVTTTTGVPHHSRQFDGPSFIGGIVLATGLMAIGFVAFKFYKARTERNYHTL